MLKIPLNNSSNITEENNYIATQTKYYYTKIEGKKRTLKNKISKNDSFFIDVEKTKLENEELKKKNSELEKYTIKNNIVTSLSKEIMYGSNIGVSLSVSELIEEKITPEMKKLGLQNLVDKLQENLYSEYKEKYSDIEKQEFLNMQVGIVKRNLKSAKIGVMKNKVNTINTPSNNIEPEEIAI